MSDTILDDLVFKAFQALEQAHADLEKGHTGCFSSARDWADYRKDREIREKLIEKARPLVASNSATPDLLHEMADALYSSGYHLDDRRSDYVETFGKDGVESRESAWEKIADAGWEYAKMRMEQAPSPGLAPAA